MQRTGNAICAYCMKETKEFWFYLPISNVCFRLTENILGHYIAKVMGDSEAEVTLLGSPKLYNGLPVEFRIRCLHDGKSEEFTIQPDKRICPHCYEERKKITYLSSLTGYVPTYTIAVVGKPSAGKTGWANSCIYGRRKEGIGKFIHSKHILSQYVRLNATQMTERNGLIQELFLTNKKGKVKALILLCDTPGELLTQDRELRGADYQWHMERVLNSDALMYILDERKQSTDLDDKKQSTESSWLSDIINYTSEDHPIAIVMTKTDKLKEECEKNDGTLWRGNAKVLTKEYFKEQKAVETAGFYEKAKHMLVDKSIIRTLVPEISGIIDEDKENAAYFAISSGTPDPNDKDILHHENAVGNFEPLGYILGCLGLYNYGRKG